jgi:iron complex transport system substrate-binding protein
LAAALVVLSLSACGTPAPPETGLTVTDQAGRTVEIAGPVERIISGYYISSSACIALGLADKMVGIEAKAASRPIYALAAPALLELPDVGTAKEFNMEGALALEPDLVILPLRLKDAADTLTGMGVPAILVNPESYDGLRGMIALIGDAAGAGGQADKLLGYYDSALASINDRTSPLTELPSVYMCGVSAYLETAPKDMYQSALIALAGGVNAAADIEGESWTEISYEQLLAMNPQVVVIPSEAGYGVEDITGDTQLAALDAVQNGRVYKMPGAFEAWDSPVPSCMLGVRWLLNVLHEDVYSADSLREDAANFYREFYGAEIDTALIEQ